MNYKNKQKKRYVNSAVIMAFLLVATFVAVNASPVAGAKEYIQPTYEFSTNYYDAYGEPDIYASVLGSPEFERGETAQVRVVLSNRGVLYGFKDVTNVDTNNNGDHAKSLKEIEYESLRTTAFGLK
ncbi:MAG: COG1361 S-layer family protein, partial [Halobacteriota archaeon]